MINKKFSILLTRRHQVREENDNHFINCKKCGTGVKRKNLKKHQKKCKVCIGSMKKRTKCHAKFKHGIKQMEQLNNQKECTLNALDVAKHTVH